jgi:hypothetical protein
MVAPAVGLGTLRRLSELETTGAALSVYLDADCLARASELEHVLDGLLGELAPSAGPREQRSLREMLASLPSLAYGTRGLALFSCAEVGAKALVPLPCTVAPMAVIDTSFWLEPIAGMFSSGDLGTVVIDRRTVRLFRGSRRLLVEFATVAGEIDRPTSRSPCGQLLPCFSAPADGPESCVERAAALLMRAQRRRAFDELVLVADDENCLASLETMLPAELRARVSERVELALGDAAVPEVAAVIAEHAHRARTVCAPTPAPARWQPRAVAHV